MRCSKCGKELPIGASFCPNCGLALSPGGSLIVVTTPTIPGYKIIKVLGVVTGLSPRTRGVLGKFVAGIQSMVGGEVTSFTTELEKARMEAIERVCKKAAAIGANAVVGLDLETSDIGLQAGVTVVSATGTAVIAEAE